MIVADASLVLAWLLEEPEHAPVGDAFDSLAVQPLVVPANWSAEIANGLRKAYRTGRLDRDDIVRLVDRLAVLDVQVAPPARASEIAALTMFAIDSSLSAYDAGYVRLALARQVSLATLDQSMRAAARRANVPLIPA